MVQFNHFYLGRVAADGTPVFVPLSLPLKGVGIFGKPGSGKTVLMSSLCRQAIDSGEVSVIFFNPKTVSNDVYAGMSDAVTAARQRRGKPIPFWRFTLTEGRSSHALKVFKGGIERLSPAKQTEVSLAGMALSMARTYGVSWFFDAAETILHHVFESAWRRGETIQSFKRLHELCEAVIQPRYKGLSDQAKEAGQHAVFIIGRLAKLEAIASDDTPDAVLEAGIDFERFVKEPCAAYFDLNAFANPLAAGEVCRICLKVFFSLISTIERKIPVIIFLDEASLLLTEGVGEILRMARETNVGLVIASQTLADFAIGQPSLLDTILGTCNMQVFFSASDPLTMRTLRELAGQRRELSLTVSESIGSGNKGTQVTYTHSEALVDRLNAREIELVNSHRHLGLLRITENEGLARFNSSLFLYRWNYDRPEWQFQEFRHSPWPDAEPGTIVVGQRGPIHPEHPEIDLSDNWEPEEIGPEREDRKTPLPPRPELDAVT